MRRSRALLLTVLVLSAAAAAIGPASASSQTIGDVGVTTDLIGILGGLTLPQLNVPENTDPGATPPAGQDNGTTAPQNTTPQQPPAAHAPGYYCKGESKRHVKGRKRTPFSQCVTAMSKLSDGSATSPAGACRYLSRKHAAGRKSPFAICVAGGKRLLADKAK
jgi:hypothetical protein